MPQGRLTRLRAAMVNEQVSVLSPENVTLINTFVWAEEKKSRCTWPGFFAMWYFESFVGCLYLDQGQDEVTKFVTKVIFPKLDEGMFAEFFDHKQNFRNLPKPMAQLLLIMNWLMNTALITTVHLKSTFQSTVKIMVSASAIQRRVPNKKPLNKHLSTLIQKETI